MLIFTGLTAEDLLLERGRAAVIPFYSFLKFLPVLSLLDYPYSS